MKALAFALALLAPLPALAQQQTPCARSQSGIKIAGLDMDETRCQLAVANDALAAQIAQSVAMRSQLLMAQSDLAAAKIEVEKARADADKAHKEIDRLKAAPKPSSK